jgi:hypothetical protein
MYKPKFTMTDRDKKKALWVTMPTGYCWNIGDVKGEMADAVQSAIIHAFELGYTAHRMVGDMCIPYGAKFEESK